MWMTLLRRVATRRGGPQGIAIGVAFVTAALHWWTPSVVAAVVPLTTGLIVTIVGTRIIAVYPDDTRLTNRVSRWSLGAFVVHLAIGLAITTSFRLTTYLGGDAIQYHQWARGILAHWTDAVALPADLPIGKHGLSYALAAIYWVFGAFQPAGLAMNAAIGALLVPLMTDTTRRLYGAAAAWWVPPLVVMPIGMLLWLSQLLREASIMFFVALALNAAVRLEKRTRLATVVTIVLCVVALLTLRNYMAITLGAGLTAGIVLGRRGVGGVGAGFVAIALGAFLVLVLGAGGSGLAVAQEQADLSRLNNIRMDSANGAASGFLQDADISTGSRAAIYLPVALPRFFLGPFPWEIRPGRQALAIPDVLTWWLLLPSLWRGFKRAWRRTRRGLLLMIMPTAGASIVLALLVANYGTVVRSRLQVYLLLIPLIALGLERRRLDRRARREAVGQPLGGARLASIS